MKSRTLLTLTVLGCLAFRCASVPPLSEAEKRKLDPSLQQLLSGRSDDPRLVRTGTRAGGEPEYAVLVRSSAREEIAATGAIVSSMFGTVLVVHGTRDELRKIVTLPAVEFMESGTRAFPQPAEHLP